MENKGVLVRLGEYYGRVRVNIAKACGGTVEGERYRVLRTTRLPTVDASNLAPPRVSKMLYALGLQGK